jgi:hypothetical protein
MPENLRHSAFLIELWWNDVSGNDTMQMIFYRSNL